MLVALVAGCGGSKHAASSSTPATTATSRAQTTGTTTSPPAASPPAASPNHRRGRGRRRTPSNGGTIPAHTDVALVGRGGRVSPATVRVAPFVAVNVALTSADGGTYVLTVAGHRITAGAAHRTATLSLPGIAPGRTYVLKASRGPAITVVSSAEPGP